MLLRDIATVSHDIPHLQSSVPCLEASLLCAGGESRDRSCSSISQGRLSGQLENSFTAFHWLLQTESWLSLGKKRLSAFLDRLFNLLTWGILNRTDGCNYCYFELKSNYRQHSSGKNHYSGTKFQSFIILFRRIQKYKSLRT